MEAPNGLAKFRVFAAGSQYEGFVVLSDGRAGYSGGIEQWRQTLPSIIAGQVRRNGLTFSGGKYGMIWLFE
jgi:hypothetical protein